MTQAEFCTRYRADGHYRPEDIHSISREVGELHAGVAGSLAPYRGNKDLAEARGAVREIFGSKIYDSITLAPNP